MNFSIYLCSGNKHCVSSWKNDKKYEWRRLAWNRGTYRVRSWWQPLILICYCSRVSSKNLWRWQRRISALWGRHQLLQYVARAARLVCSPFSPPCSGISSKFPHPRSLETHPDTLPIFGRSTNTSSSSPVRKVTGSKPWSFRV